MSRSARESSPFEANIPRMYAMKFLLSMHFIGGVLVPFFTDWGGITFTQVMLLQSWFVFCIFALEIPTGAVADFFGRKASLLCGAAATTAAALVYVSKPDFLVFMLAESIWALGGALISGADQALVYDSLKSCGREKQSKRVLGRFGSFMLLGIMVAAPIGGLLADRFGLRAPFLCMTIPMAAAFFLGWTLREPPAAKKSETRRYWETMLDGVRYFRGHRILRVLAFDLISVYIAAFMMIWLFQPFLKELGVGIAYFGVVMSLCTGAQLGVMNSFDRLERLAGGRRRFLFVSAIVPGLAFLGLSLTKDPFAATALIVAVTGFGLPRATLISNYMNKHISSHNRATVLSTVSMLRQLTGALVYPVVGVLTQWSLRGSLAVLGSAVLVCAVVSRVEEGHLTD